MEEPPLRRFHQTRTRDRKQEVDSPRTRTWTAPHSFTSLQELRSPVCSSLQVQMVFLPFFLLQQQQRLAWNAFTRLPPPSSASMIQNELRRSLCASEAGAAAEFHEDDGCAAACVCVWSRQSVCWLLFTGAHLHCCCFTADPCCIQVLWGKKGREEPGLNVQCGSASKGGYYSPPPPPETVIWGRTKIKLK